MAYREKANNLRGLKEAAFNALFSFNGSCSGLASKLLNSISQNTIYNYIINNLAKSIKYINSPRDVYKLVSSPGGLLLYYIVSKEPYNSYSIFFQLI